MKRTSDLPLPLAGGGRGEGGPRPQSEPRNPRRPHLPLALPLLVAVLLFPTSAAARSVAVDVVGCPPPEGLREALALELATTDWTLAEAEDGAEIRVALEACDERRWIARLADATGQPLRPPVDLEVAELPPRSRARVAALWLAEWLETVSPSAAGARLDRPARPVDDGTGPPVPSAETESLRIRAMGLGSFRHHEDTPATFGGGDLIVQLARTGLPVLAFELGLGVEGGLRQNITLMTVSGSFAATAGFFAIPSWLELTAGARFSLRHLAVHGFDQLDGTEVTAPWHTTLGGLVRATMFLDRGLALVLDVELGGAISAAVATTPARLSGDAILPGREQALFDGFYVAARAGVALE